MSQFNTPPAFRFSRKPAPPPPRLPPRPSYTGRQDGSSNPPSRPYEERRLALGHVQTRQHRTTSPQKTLTRQAVQNEGDQTSIEPRRGRPRGPDDREPTKHGGDEDETMLDWQPSPANQAAETQDFRGQHSAERAIRQETHPDPLPKRRRLDPPADTRLGRSPTVVSLNTDTPHTPSRPRFRAPASPSLQHNASTTPIFNTPRPFHAVLQSTHTYSSYMDPASSNFNGAPTTSRPRFILPNSTTSHTSPSPFTSAPNLNQYVPAQPQPPATALPDIFSPHKRKHERFVPGGWAAQVRNWVLDISVAGGEQIPTAYGLSTSKGRGEQKEVEMVVRSVETAGAGGGVGVVGMVRGEIVGGKEGEGDVSVVLVGEGEEGGSGRRGAGIERRSVRGSDVRGGKFVVLGLPAWEVDVTSSERRTLDDLQREERDRWVICPVWKTK